MGFADTAGAKRDDVLASSDKSERARPTQFPLSVVIASKSKLSRLLMEGNLAT